MAKARNKTVPNAKSPAQFLNGIASETKRRDAKAIDRLLRRVSGEKPTMWGSSIVGYGQYHYRYESGREGDHMRIGFSPRAQNFAVYIMPGFDGAKPLLKKLGKHETGKSCLYFKKLEDVDLGVLEDLAALAWKEMARRYPD